MGNFVQEGGGREEKGMINSHLVLMSKTLQFGEA